MKRILYIVTAIAFMAMAVTAWGSTPGAAAGSGSHPRQSKHQPTRKNATIVLPDQSYVASVVGVTPAVLRRDLAAGKTLLQIAGGKFASASDLATALLAPLKTKLDAAVTSGLSRTKAETSYAQMHDAVAHAVVTPHPLFSSSTVGKKPAQGSGNAADGIVFSTMAAVCHTTATAFQAALTTGASPLAICQRTNPDATQDAVLAALVAAVQQAMNPAPTAEQHVAIEQKLTYWLTSSGSPTPGQGKKP